ncbi:MAG: ankyrin repeat domain-containing protein [Microcystaceae cyanobacterium]
MPTLINVTISYQPIVETEPFMLISQPKTHTLLQQWLLERNYNPDDLDQRGYNQDTAIMTATKEGNLPIVQALVEAGANINLTNDDGNNALWYACVKKQTELITYLVDSNINIDNQNGNGVTCLMYASSSGKLEILQQLLNLGADYKLKNLDDFTATDFASTFEILKLLKNVRNP